MKSILSPANLCLVVLAVVLLVTPVAWAETAVKWQDSSGRVFYGSNPPSSAKNVQKVPGKSFSRYSSERLLKPYRGRLATTKAAPVVRETDLPDPLPPPSEGAQTEPAIPVQETQTPADTSAPEFAQPLKQGKLVLERNDEGEITKCQVMVANTAQSSAKNVSVAFEFEDGSYIPALGADSIAAGAEASYAVPSELLPLDIKFSRNLNGKQPTELLPKVIIDGLTKAE